MGKPAASEIRPVLEEYYAKAFADETREYLDRIRKAAGAAIDADVLRTSLEGNCVVEPPQETRLTSVMVDAAVDAIGAIYDDVTNTVYFSGHSVSDRTRVVRCFWNDDMEEEPISFAALAFVAARLLNVAIKSLDVETVAEDDRVHHEYSIRINGWIDKECGEAEERYQRLVRARRRVSDLEGSLLDAKKALAKLEECDCAKKRRDLCDENRLEAAKRATKRPATEDGEDSPAKRQATEESAAV
jgi:hypothetical protein